MCREFDRRAEKLLLQLESTVPDLTCANWIINVGALSSHPSPTATTVLSRSFGAGVNPSMPVTPMCCSLRSSRSLHSDCPASTAMRHELRNAHQSY